MGQRKRDRRFRKGVRPAGGLRSARPFERVARRRVSDRHFRLGFRLDTLPRKLRHRRS